MRLWRSELRRLRADLALHVRPPVEHEPDPGGRVLGDHAGDAPVPARCDRGRPRTRPDVRAARLPRGAAAAASLPGRHGRVVPLLYAALAAAGEAAGPQPSDLAAAPRVT